jgi:hypothetical protein
MPAYPQVAHFDVSLAIQFSSRWLDDVRASVPSGELVRLKTEVGRIPSQGSVAVTSLESEVPYNCLDKYLNAAFRCTVLPVEAIATQLTFVVIADLGCRSQNGSTFADYRNSNGELVKGKLFWEEAENYYGLTGRPEQSTFCSQVVDLHQKLRYPEFQMPRQSEFRMPSRQHAGETVEDYYQSEFRDELKSVASQTYELVRCINYSLLQIELSVLQWRSALKKLSDSKPEFWLGENARSFDLAMTELNKLYRWKDPQITSPIRAVRKLLAQRVRDIPDMEISGLIISIESLQGQIALREVPVGEALSDVNKLRLLSEVRTLKEELHEKCGRLLQIRQDLFLIHKQIDEDFEKLDKLLETLTSDVEKTRSRFGIDQVPSFFRDTNFSSKGRVFEKAGWSVATINLQPKLYDAGVQEQIVAFVEAGAKEGVGFQFVKGATGFVSAAQAGQLSKSFLASMKVAPLVGALVQSLIATSEIAQQQDLIIKALRESLPIPNKVFEDFVLPEISKVFDQTRLEKIKKIVIASLLVLPFGAVPAIFLASAFALAMKIEESEDYKKLVRDIQQAVATGFKAWEKSLVEGNS